MTKKWIMDVKIKALHFSISEKLEKFTTKKVSKVIAKYDDIVSANVILKVIKPESNNNKEVEIHLIAPGNELFAKKTASTFEEAIDLTIEAIKRQLEKQKFKTQNYK